MAFVPAHGFRGTYYKFDFNSYSTELHEVCTKFHEGISMYLKIMVDKSQILDAFVENITNQSFTHFESKNVYILLQYN